MNVYEIVLSIWLSLLTIGFFFVIFDLFDVLDRIKKLDDNIKKSD